MWRSVSASVLTLFVLCSWFWTIGLPMLRSHEIVTTSVEVNLYQQSAAPQDNASSGGRVRGPHDDRKAMSMIKKHGGTQYMLDLYRKYTEHQVAGSREGRGVDVVRSLVPRSIGSMLPADGTYHRARERRQLLVFDVPASKRDETLHDAQLRINIRHRKGHTPTRDGVAMAIRVSVLDVGDVLHDVAVLPPDGDTDADAWMTFNVTSALVTYSDVARKWTTLRLVVRQADDVDQASADVETLLLLSYSTPKPPPAGPQPSLRRKRNAEAEDYEEESNHLWDDDLLTAPRVTSSNSASRRARRLRNTCRRRPLHVDFSEIHYDTWIVAPNGYEAFQCLGKCFFPVGEHLSPTKHAIVQTLVHSVSPGKVSRACCVPTRLDPISVLYVDHRGVLTYRFNYQDMVVAECGCR